MLKSSVVSRQTYKILLIIKLESYKGRRGRRDECVNLITSWDRVRYRVDSYIEPIHTSTAR